VSCDYYTPPLSAMLYQLHGVYRVFEVFDLHDNSKRRIIHRHFTERLARLPRRPSYDDTRLGFMQQEAPRRSTPRTTTATVRTAHTSSTATGCVVEGVHLLGYAAGTTKDLTPAALLAALARTVAALARPVPVRAAPHAPLQGPLLAPRRARQFLAAPWPWRLATLRPVVDAEIGKGWTKAIINFNNNM
jgi:hypothetical protein